jgi:hypothetical protein
VEQIIIRAHNKEKARILAELLATMDFIDSVEIHSDRGEAAVTEADSDFFALAGLWKGREITQESIRYRGIRPAW